MKWAHLPLSGGIYNQSPQLLDEWAILFELSNKKANEDHKASMAKMNQAKNKRR